MDSNNPPHPDAETQVLVIGAGPAGATTALLLASLGIHVIVISRHRGTATTPRAHIFNQRAMEVLRDAGLEEKITPVVTSARHMMHTSWLHSLNGAEYGRWWAWGNRPSRLGDYAAASPCEMSDLPQHVLEPILVEEALKRGADIRFYTEFMSQRTEANGNVKTTVRHRASGSVYSILAEYLIGADGARSPVLESLGIPIDGKRLNTAFNVHIKADLSKYLEHRPGSLNWILNPEAPEWSAVGNFRMVNPWTEWVVSMHPAQKDGNVFEPTDEDILKRLHQMIGDSTIPIEILSHFRWTINDQVARRWQNGKVICIGDAVHRHPPINGLGSNTCISDAMNLAWKLAFVLQGTAGPKILDSVTVERKPVGDGVVRRANDGMEVHRTLWSLLGLSKTERESKMNLMAQATREGAELRAMVRAAIEKTDDEFQALGIQMNQIYTSSPLTVVEEGDSPPEFSHLDLLKDQAVSTFPGYHLPHVWLAKDGQSPRISILDLAGKGIFTLFTGIGGERWQQAAGSIRDARGRPLVRCYSIGWAQDYMDAYGDWQRVRGVEEDGAVLATDPISAFALVSSVIQVVDFGLKTISKCREIALHGSTAVTLDAQYVTGHLKDFSEDLRSSLASSSVNMFVSRNDQQMQELAVKCGECAKDLLVRLEKLKTEKTQGKLKVLQKGLETIWKRGDLAEVQNRLEGLRRTLDTRMLARLFDMQSLQALRQHTDFSTLSEASQNIFNNFVSGQRSVIGLVSSEHQTTRQVVGQGYATISTTLASESLRIRSTLEHESRVTRRELHSEVNAMKDSLKEDQAAKQTRELTKRRLNEVKTSLWFRRMRMRQQMLTDAHATTFQWILGIENAKNESSVEQQALDGDLVSLSQFEHVHATDAFIMYDERKVGTEYGVQRSAEELSALNDRKHAGDQFTNWLKEGHGIYWINGKAGSGKSTLMNLIERHERTSELLRQWAGSSELLRPVFFFWNSGSLEQIGVLGCLRSLVYQCLEDCPALLDPLLGFLGLDTVIQDSSTSLHISEWTIGQLAALLRHFITQSTISCRFCFFLDGLDELEGPFRDLLHLLQNLDRFHNVKLCISSRPLYDFTRAFSGALTIKLEYFTAMDIQKLVQDRLISHLIDQKLGKSLLRGLCQDIVSRAEGVFLWVIFAIGELEQGMEYRDTAKQLRRRLQDLPDELDKMYANIVSKIPRVYQDQSKRFLRHMIFSAKVDGSPSVLLFSLMEETKLLDVFFQREEAHSMLSDYVAALPGISTNCEEVDDHLRTRCAGLLIITCAGRDKFYLQDTHHNDQCKSFPHWWGCRVAFLYRTFRDFLLETDAGTKLLGCEPSQDLSMIDVQTSAVLACIGILMINLQHQYFSGENVTLQQYLNRLLGIAGTVSLDLQYELFCRAEQLFMTFAKIRTVEKSILCKRGYMIFDAFRGKPQTEIIGHAAWLGCVDIVRRRLDEHSKSNAEREGEFETYLLRCALDGLNSCLQSNESFSTEYQPPARLVHELLARKANPNATYADSRYDVPNSIWHQYLVALCRVAQGRQNQVTWDYAGLTSAFVSAGADIHSLCKLDSQQYAWKALSFATQLELQMGTKFLYLHIELSMSPLGVLHHFSGHSPWYKNVERVLRDAGAECIRDVQCSTAPVATSKGQGSPWTALAMDETVTGLFLKHHSQFLRSLDSAKEMREAVKGISYIVRQARDIQNTVAKTRPTASSTSPTSGYDLESRHFMEAT